MPVNVRIRRLPLGFDLTFAPTEIRVRSAKPSIHAVVAVISVISLKNTEGEEVRRIAIAMHCPEMCKHRLCVGVVGGIGNSSAPALQTDRFYALATPGKMPGRGGIESLRALWWKPTGSLDFCARRFWGEGWVNSCSMAALCCGASEGLMWRRGNGGGRGKSRRRLVGNRTPRWGFMGNENYPPGVICGGGGTHLKTRAWQAGSGGRYTPGSQESTPKGTPRYPRIPAHFAGRLRTIQASSSEGQKKRPHGYGTMRP